MTSSSQVKYRAIKDTQRAQDIILAQNKQYMISCTNFLTRHGTADKCFPNKGTETDCINCLLIFWVDNAKSTVLLFMVITFHDQITRLLLWIETTAVTKQVFPTLSFSYCL